jgi:hypothetical protein
LQEVAQSASKKIARFHPLQNTRAITTHSQQNGYELKLEHAIYEKRSKTTQNGKENASALSSATRCKDVNAPSYPYLLALIT